MEEEIKESLIWSIVKFGIILIISWLIVLIMFAMALPGDEIDEKYNIFIFTGGILLALSISMVRDYNQIQKCKAKIPKLKKDIESVKKTCNNLLNKANRVADKYLSHEYDVMKDIANSRKHNTNIIRVKDANEFKNIVENYPDLKANSAIMRLLEQLEYTESKLLKTRTDYSAAVAKYNAKIHTFPFSILRRILKFEDVQIEEEPDDLVSDEELGI